MAGKTHGALVAGTVWKTLARLSLPMAMGMIFMILVNIIDTFWVARLGTKEVAAMTFTFPVVGLVINIALGLMIGTSTAVARAIGGGHQEEASKLTTYAMYLSLIVVAVVSCGGVLSQDYLFRVLGAEPDLIVLIKEYMTIWYIGVVFLVIPLIANGALRAMGDAKTPMTVMILAAVLNAILDPLFIFGFGPIPALGLTGAAIATLIARFVGMVYVLWILLRKTDLLVLHIPVFSTFVDLCKRILSVGAPAAVTNALGPFAVGLITAVVAAYGAEALAAYGIGARVDALVLIFPGALGGALSPFVGQNWGAHLIKRVAEGIQFALRFVLGWGIFGAVVLFASAPMIAQSFSEDPKVIQSLVIYLQTIPVGYAFLAVVSITSSAFNAVDRALRSTMLSILRSIVIAVPAAYLGGYVYGLKGVFLGIVVASMVTSILGIAWMRYLLNPNGRVSPDLGREVSNEESIHLINNDELADVLGQLLPPVLELEEMTLRHKRGRIVGFYVGTREIAHIHPEGRLDLQLPIEVGENLVHRGVVIHHPQHEDHGWYSHHLSSRQEVNETIWLIRLVHLLYELSQRGDEDPLTKQEMAAFTVSQRCIDSMVAAADRWELAIEPLEA